MKVRPPAVIVPERAFNKLASKLNEISPLVVPELPPVIEIHGALLTAVQLHPATVVKVNCPVPAVAATLELVGRMEKVQPDAWLIVKVCPPAVIVAVRAGPTLACTLNETVPLVLPALPPVTVTHGSLLAAVHAHPVTVVSVKVLFAPLTAIFVLVGESANVHPLA